MEFLALNILFSHLTHVIGLILRKSQKEGTRSSHVFVFMAITYSEMQGKLLFVSCSPFDNKMTRIFFLTQLVAGVVFLSFVRLVSTSNPMLL